MMRMRLQPVVVAAQFVERGNGGVARAIRVVDRGAVDRLAVFPNGQLLGDGERLAVAHDHADDVVIRRHPRRNEGVDAHARQTDLALGAVRMLVGIGGQLFFMGAPAHLGRGRSFFAEALNAPGIDELVHLFGLVGDLRVALAAMNDLDAELLGQVVKVPRLGVVRDSLRLRPAEFLFRQRCSAMSSSACLVKWLIRPGLAPCSITAVGPGSLHLAIIRRRFMCRQ
jgi:hypothetical protein